MPIRIRTIKFWPLLCAILLVTASSGTAKTSSSINPKLTAACKVSPDFDPETNAHAIEDYRAAIQQLLIHEDFADIECLANSARKNEEQFKGGVWKLHNIYSGLDEPKDHPIEADWADHFNRMQRWIAARPHSITARIALAESYTSYAWDARGNGSSDSVTDRGLELFNQRSAQAETTLREAAALKAKCPEWYYAMQQVALAEGWDRSKANALFEDAIAMESDYYYFYRMYANYLLPKWYGEQGETEKFMESSADRIGGEKGDILYFQIGSYLVCHCNEEHIKAMSWPRLQKGFAALQQQTGDSLLTLNEMAYLAYKENDVILANDIFARIGENWSEEAWRSKYYFTSARKWVEAAAPGEILEKKIRDEAEANTQTPEGQAYVKRFEERFGPLIQKCELAGGNAKGNDDVLLMFRNLYGIGNITSIIHAPSTDFQWCVLNSFTPPIRDFPTPPGDNYWLKIPLNPGPLAEKKSDQE